MRLAIDAITQAEGAAPAAVSTPTSPVPAPARSQKPATTPAAPVTATVLPTAQPTQQTTTQPQPANAPAPDNVTPVEDQTPDGKNGQDVGQDVNTSAAPAEINRITANAEAKLQKARVEYLATLQNPTNGSLPLPSSLHSQGVIAPPSILSSRLVNKRSTSLTPLTASDPDTTAPRPELNPMPFRNWSKGSKRKS
jgi:hypothetical protein